MTYQHNTDQINQLADKLEDPELANMRGLGWKAAFHLRELQGRIAELEAMLDAVGAGGVGESIRPAAIDAIRLAEATFRAYGDHHAAKPDEEKAQRNYQLADTMRAALLAAVPDAPNPASQPLTDEKLYALYCEAMKGYYVSALHYWRKTEAHKFARVIEAAHGITGGQQ